MDLNRIRELSLEIKRLEGELDVEKRSVLEHFRNMSEVDKALEGTKIFKNGVSIQYFPASITKQIDSNKLKQDGIYDKYTKEVTKSDYIKLSVAKED